MGYAEKTSVPVSKTKADIEELIQKSGACQFVSGKPMLHGNKLVVANGEHYISLLKRSLKLWKVA